MFLDLLAAAEFLIRIILPVKLLLRRQDFKMTRKVTGESKIKEVFKYAGKKLLVVHFFDKERYCKGLRMKNSAGSFYLAEINKLPELPNNKEHIKSITKLIDKYMPTSVTRLVFFRNGKRVRFEDFYQDKILWSLIFQINHEWVEWVHDDFIPTKFFGEFEAKLCSKENWKID